MKTINIFFQKTKATAFAISCLLFLALISGKSYGQITLLDPNGAGGFENGTTFAANGWTAVGTVAPTWYVGTAAGVKGGTNSAFIGTNATTFGSSATARTSHIYKDIAIPAGAQNVSLSFYLKYLNFDAGYDYLFITITNTLNTITDGTIPSIGAGEDQYYWDTELTSFTQIPIDLTAFAGTTIRLVFTFKNDAVAPNAYFAIDNISLTCDNNNKKNNFTSSGSFTAPIGITSVTAECWGGGGAGGGQNLTSDGGGGGGGGAYSKKNTYSVISGDSYIFTVGTGGTGVAGSTGNSGGDSYFINTSTVLAKGGSGGSPSTGTPPVGGAGGVAGSGIGDVKYSGGQGEKGRDNNIGRGGYGGSSAGTSSDGYSGPQTWSTLTYPIASTPTGAGHGGDGGTNSVNGSAPASGNGGGGGGSGEGTNMTGGSGANGKVSISYTCITITSQPTNQMLCATSSASFSVTSSAPSLSYQWTYNGVNVANGTPAGAVYSGSTSSTLNISGTIAVGTYSAYQCKLSNACGSVISGNANLTVSSSTPISITTQPTNQILCSGGSAEFSVISSTPSITYQWQYNGSNVINGTPTGAVYSGGNSSTLNVSGTISAGTYSPYKCVLTNSCESKSTINVQLTVSASAAPANPTNPTISSAACVVTLTAAGSPPSNVNWYWQGQNCGKRTDLGSSNTYTVPQSGTYYISAYNTILGCWSASCGSVDAILEAPTFITHPQSQYGCVGSTITFNIIATGSGLTYQWRKNGVNITGATSDTYSIPTIAAGDAGNYDCVVTGTCGNVTSTAATLTIISSGLTGIKTVGTSGNYTTLKAAFDAVNTNGLSGDLELQIISNITETAEASLNQWVDCAGLNGYSIKIYPTGATRTISGAIATSLITLNGSDRVTFEGRLNQTGAANSLILSNTSTAGSTVKFINDACKNTMKYTTLLGVNISSTSGVIHFSTAYSSGNDNNTITYCTIKDGASTPRNGIYSFGTVGKENDNNAVSYCNIYNFYTYASNSFGIIVLDNNTKWNINNNSIYQTATRNAGDFYGIYVASSLGSEYSIQGNFVGGTSPECGGASAMTYTDGGYSPWFQGIYLSCSTSGISYIKENTVKNINFGTSPYSDKDFVFFPIMTQGGRIDVIGNDIGEQSSTGSIVLNVTDNSTYKSFAMGIYKDGDGNVLNNKIGSISITGTSGDACSFYGIQILGTLISDALVSGNTIGSLTTSNSIQCTATPALNFCGILFGTDGNYNTTVSNNIISNIQSNSTGATPWAMGIDNEASGGTQKIIGNTISKISTVSTNINANNSSSIAGIASMNTTTAGHTVSQNTIYSLTSTGNAAVNIFGIICYHALGLPTYINQNTIYDFNTTSTSSVQTGIKIYSGPGEFYNNMISLGTTTNTSALIRGIWQFTTSNCNYYFNSVYIGGAATVGAINTYGFVRDQASTVNFKNNILYNARTGGTGKHFAITTNTVTTFTSDYNDLFTVTATNLGSYNAGGTPQTFATWKTGTSQDANSINLDPLFMNNASNLHIQNGSPARGKGIFGTGVLIDIDNQIRKTGVNPDGPCIGADENLTAPFGTDAYGIHASDGISGNITDCEIYAEGGTPGGIGYQVANPADIHWANVNIKDYKVITATNSSCLNSNITFATTSSSPNWLLGNGSNPSSSTISPTVMQYTSTGRKDIIENVKVFKDFTNMTMPVPNPGLILGAPSGAGCPTTYSYTSSVAGSAGFEYYWTATAPAGCTATIASPYVSTTDITFQNPTGHNQVFLLTLYIKTECCGPLELVKRYITIYPGPVQPTVTGSPFSLCTGGSLTVNVNTPDPSYAYDWYNASTGGTLLGSGSSFTDANVHTGTNHYYVQSTNSFGCSSPRTDIVQVGNDATPPSLDNQQTCGVGMISLFVNSPQAGYTYNWYTSSCNGTLVQSSTSSSINYNLASNTTFYVSAMPIGCAASSCTAVNASIITPPNPITWLGTVGGANNWFNPANWASSCLPTCETNVTIPTTTNNPDIGFNPSEVAQAKNITIQSGVTLSFSDSKAVLDVCGNFVHTGTLTTNGFGEVKFTGTAAQTYTKTGTGDFHNIKLSNTSGLTLNNDLVLDATGIFSFVDGKVATGSNTLVIKNTNTASIENYGLSKYIYGKLRRHINSGSYTYLFPVGASGRYTPAELINSGLTGVTYIDGTFLSSFTNSGSINPANAHDGPVVYSLLCNEGVWKLDPTPGPSGGSYSIKLWFNDGGGSNPFSGLSDNMFCPLKRPSGSSSAADWTALGGTLNTPSTDGVTISGGFAQRTGWTSFSEYAIGVTTSPLPVELLYFENICYNGKLKLTWSTASEQNNDFFTIERSTDAINWNFVAKINGAGNSQNQRTYEYLDQPILGQIVYYRISQTDYDGTKKTSSIVSSYCNNTNNASANIYVFPNPTDSQLNVVIEGEEFDDGVMEIIDNIGQAVSFIPIVINNYSTKITISLSNLSPGSYYLRFKMNKITLPSQKIILNR